MKNSSRPFTRWLFQFCGSIKLAMLLMGVLIVAICIGTIVESRLDTSVAQSYVYDAPWFIAWIFLLCVNLVGAVLVRYPWKPHQIGFVITHGGIVVLLIGAVIGRIWGFEGSVTLFKSQPPIDYLLTGRQELRAEINGANGIHELNLSSRAPTSAHSEKFKLGNVEIAAMDFAPELGIRTVVEKASSGGTPALRLVMTSAMVRQPLDRWLVLDNADHGQITFGPAMIRYISGKPANDSVESAPRQVPSRELHFAFAKMPQMNIARTSAGAPTGLKVNYVFDPAQSNDASKGKLEITSDAGSFTFSVAELSEREVPLNGTPWKLRFLDYFADLRMQGKTPVSVSDKPNNPAVLFEILGPMVAEGVSPRPAHTHGGSSAPTMAELTLYRDADGQLKFQSRSRTKASHQGEIKIGEEFSPGLADWKCRVEEVSDHAVLKHEFAPLSDEAPQATGASGLLVHASNGSQADMRWIRMGQPTRLPLGNEEIELTFAHKLRPLDFTLQLEKFEVEMNEGTQNPAGFKSFVRFHDPKSDTTLTRAIWMNNPANFPQFAGAGLLGTSYKFSQSSWNPDNLDETTLQVVRDPGWSLKWIGSLLLCAGLFTMFYLKPYPRFAANKTAPPADVQIRNPLIHAETKSVLVQK